MQVLDFITSRSPQLLRLRIIGTRRFDDEVHFMRNLRKIALLYLAVYCLQSRAIAQTCPPPPTSIDPSLSSSVSYDINTQTYIYRYTLRNGNRSALPINYFILSLAQQPFDVQSPANWISRYINFSSAPSNLRWATITESPSTPLNIGGSDLASPAYAVQPGTQLSGFGLSSSQPPGSLQYRVQGFVQIPSATATPSDDEPAPNCQGWDFNSPYLKTLVTGIAIGPSTPNVISVAIRLRDEAGEHRYGPIDPNKPTGNIGVLVHSSRTFDASAINASSIRFGPADAVPLSSRLVPSGSGKDADE